MRWIKSDSINGSENLWLGDREMNGDDIHAFTQACVIVCKLGMYAQREQSGDMLWRLSWIANFSWRVPYLPVILELRRLLRFTDFHLLQGFDYNTGRQLSRSEIRP